MELNVPTVDGLSIILIPIDALLCPIFATKLLTTTTLFYDIVTLQLTDKLDEQLRE
jgi:hypothetical protein